MKEVGTLIVGGGQAGLAMSEHLARLGQDHLILEKDRIVEKWRSARWDSLVANGPAWHDRFASKMFSDTDPDGFPTKESVISYFETFAEEINAPLLCGVEVLSVTPNGRDGNYLVETSDGPFSAPNVVAATGPFQVPIIPQVVPPSENVNQLHSARYYNPEQLEDGVVLVVGAGSSGCQIADELLRSGREVYLSIGPHERPPRSYRGKDFVWWLRELGKWQMRTPPEGREHVTIAVSGARGGETVDFRQFAARGMTLVGMTQSYENSVLTFADDLAANIEEGDANYLSLLQEADDFIEAQGLDMPPEEEAKIIKAAPDCMTKPTLELDLKQAGITNIIWATGYRQDFGWLQVDCFDADGIPVHHNGVSKVQGVYFLGLPWLTSRGSSFIWGVWHDAAYLAKHIAKRQSS